jgi:hypothetical protein
MVEMPVNTTMERRGMAIAMNAGPKRETWATSASAMTAPERMDRKMVTRLRDSL